MLFCITKHFCCELNIKLHPLLLKFIIDLFYDDKSSAQLIYTTHDTTLMDKKFFRRDQVWFVQKDQFGYSELVALSDFKVRSDASFEKDYLAGVYGGIPNFKEFELKEGEQVWVQTICLRNEENKESKENMHLNYSDAALHRHEWNKKLDKLFSEYNLGDGCYKKNYEDIYTIVNSFGGVNTAIKNAKRRMANFNEEKDLPSKYNPGTTVHELVMELKKYL